MKKVKAPKGAQLLIYPMYDCTIAAGFKNAAYKKNYGYAHYGLDFDSRAAVDFDVIASGDGVVVATEINKNSIGGVIIVRYDNVYNPTTKKTQSIIVRYYHMYQVLVKKNDKVKAYQVIGKVSGSHKWWNHIHYEVDTDTRHPTYTPQVGESSSRLLVRKGATDKTMFDPLKILVVGKKQKAMVHNLAIFASKTKDAPKFEEE